MPTIDGASLNGLLSNPLVLGVSIAGTLAVLLAVLLVVMARGSGAGGMSRASLAILAALLGGIAIVSIAGLMAQNERGAERRALAQRSAELTAQAVAPGSTLACLDGAAGEALENACEQIVFAGPTGTAAAVSYMAARLTLLADGLAFARRSDPGFAATLDPLRRAIELDRFGVAAHVLAVRDGCTANRCAVFALLNDANVIKSNLKAQIFDQYVSRYASSWAKTEPVAEKQPPAPAPSASLPGPQVRPAMSSKFSFPSAASIPPVSIMNSEPPLPKAAADAQAAQPPVESRAPMPVPAKRPQNQAATPPAR